MTVLGGFAVASMLALSSPGVRAVRAADEVADGAGEAAVCQAGPAPNEKDVWSYLGEMQRREAEQIAEQMVAPRSDDETIVLNNRGYNYDAGGFEIPRAGEIDAR
jgi:hypothetical protein